MEINLEKIEFYRKQIELEKKIIEITQETLPDIDNKVVHELINGITMDSNKHISILTALIALDTDTSGIKLIQENIRDKLKQKIDQHIKLEKKAIDTYKELYNVVKGEKEKFLIKAILNDEIRHHSTLQKVYNIIIEDITLKENDIYDLLFEDIIPEY